MFQDLSSLFKDLTAKEFKLSSTELRLNPSTEFHPSFPKLEPESIDLKFIDKITEYSNQECLIHKEDRRRHITEEEMKSFPYSAIISLDIFFKDDIRITGTGFMIGPKLILTAYHNMYLDNNKEKLAEEVYISPGRFENNFPFGIFRASSMLILDYKVFPNSLPHHDLVLITLSEDIGKYTGWFGLKEFDLKASKENLYDKSCEKNPDILASYQKSEPNKEETELNITGYVELKEEKFKGFVLKSHFGRVLKQNEKNNNLLEYEIDTSHGQSGSPVYVENKETGFYAVGVHTFGGKKSNKGVKITKEILQKISLIRNYIEFAERLRPSEEFQIRYEDLLKKEIELTQANLKNLGLEKRNSELELKLSFQNSLPNVIKKPIKTIKAILIGDSGSGKTHFLNFLYLWQDRTISKTINKMPRFMNDEITKSISHHSFQIEQNDFVYELFFIDTPGFYGHNSRDEEVSDILATIKNINDINTILIVQNGTLTRYSSYVEKILRSINSSLPLTGLKNCFYLLSNVSLKEKFDAKKNLENIESGPRNVIQVCYDNNFSYEEQINLSIEENLKTFEGLVEKIKGLLKQMENADLKIVDKNSSDSKREKYSLKIINFFQEEFVVNKKLFEIESKIKGLTLVDQKENPTLQGKTDFINTNCLECENTCHYNCNQEENTNSRRILIRCSLFENSNFCKFCGHESSSHFHSNSYFKNLSVLVKENAFNIKFGPENEDLDKLNTEANLIRNKLVEKRKGIHSILFEMQTESSPLYNRTEIEFMIDAIKNSIKALNKETHEFNEEYESSFSLLKDQKKILELFLKKTNSKLIFNDYIKN